MDRLKRGDKVRFIGKLEPGGWTEGIYIQSLGRGRVEVKPMGCHFVTVDPRRADIEKVAQAAGSEEQA